MKIVNLIQRKQCKLTRGGKRRKFHNLKKAQHITPIFVTNTVYRKTFMTGMAGFHNCGPL